MKSKEDEESVCLALQEELEENILKMKKDPVTAFLKILEKKESDLIEAH